LGGTLIVSIPTIIIYLETCPYLNRKKQEKNKNVPTFLPLGSSFGFFRDTVATNHTSMVTLIGFKSNLFEWLELILLQFVHLTLKYGLSRLC
jgi:hypothetical protein